MAPAGDFLSRILSARRDRIAAAKAGEPIDALRRRAEGAGQVRDFRAALAAPGMSVIAEFKRASPSRGMLNASLDPEEQARAYQRGGARAISVLTEPDFFQARPDDLRRARAAASLPVLWKDFVIDLYQVALARAETADAALLIVRILDDDALAQLLGEIASYGMTALVEVFGERDLKRALEAGADVIGVNHRDLETFVEDTEATTRLRPLVPPGVVVVGESAISTRADVQALEAIGVNAVLVGEALVKSADPAAKIRELLAT